MNIQLFIANKTHQSFAQQICDLIEDSAKRRGTGIARRKKSYVEQKISSGNAVIALEGGRQLVGFCYIETWSHEKYVANSGLVVHPDFRQLGLARQIKTKAFNLAQSKYPSARIFGITTSAAVMKINSELGYRPVPFSELTQEKTFWKGCQSCPNYDILQRNNRSMCLCTGMLAVPNEKKSIQETKKNENESI